MSTERKLPSTLTRQQLYEKVWATPATILAREFGISDVALGKACRRHKIPKPPRGYWAAKRIGTVRTPPPLPNIDDPKLETATFEIVGRPAEIPESAEIRAKAAAEKSAKVVTVPIRIGRLHPLVARTKAAMVEAHPNYKNMVWPHGKACLGISVGKSSGPRAIRIMNALVYALEARGFPVSTGQDDRKTVTVVTIQGEQVKFRLEESQKMAKRATKPGDTLNEGYDYVPSGKLVLTITSLTWTGARQHWHDTEKTPIENRLNSFIAGLIAATEIIKIKRVEQERRQREWAAEHLRRAEAERLRVEAEKRINELDRVVANWQKSQIIRSFCDSVAQRMCGGGGGVINPEGELGKWLDWARRRADELDPIRPDCVLIPA
jgi:hypothetical protein